jgi:hypothetical protein
VMSESYYVEAATERTWSIDGGRGWEQRTKAEEPESVS